MRIRSCCSPWAHSHRFLASLERRKGLLKGSQLGRERGDVLEKVWRVPSAQQERSDDDERGFPFLYEDGMISPPSFCGLFGALYENLSSKSWVYFYFSSCGEGEGKSSPGKSWRGFPSIHHPSSGEKTTPLLLLQPATRLK